ncbi:hypothetical protein [Halobacterium yunchengense]|uniref:hypothetical protein n=1 Tax=Halobacterium yunchengense TaxID=3108497 RepID=UPI0030080002
MTGTNPDAPTGPLDDLPGSVDGASLLGVDGTGAPIYFDEADDRAFEALQRDGEWVVGEERASAPLADAVAEIGELTGWEALSEFGERASED